jgi:hypothetical protein
MWRSKSADDDVRLIGNKSSSHARQIPNESD